MLASDVGLRPLRQTNTSGLLTIPYLEERSGYRQCCTSGFVGKFADNNKIQESVAIAECASASEKLFQHKLINSFPHKQSLRKSVGMN